MKTNTINLIILFIFSGSLLYSQLDFRAELSIRGGFDDYAVLPSGKIYLATKAGMTYFTNEINEPWEIGPIKLEDDDFFGKHMDRVSFFNDSIGIISGYLHKEDYSLDYIYRTVDGGKSWKKIYLEYGKWIDAEDTDKYGNAWLASADQLIYYTKDYGKNWTIIDRPENKTNQRIVTIDFIDDKEGIAGTGWNRLYYTKNNGIDWEILPTPLQQNKYVAPENHRPGIDKVVITSKQMIVSQAGKIFYTDKDSINWNRILDTYKFDFDSEKDLIYLYYNNGKICLHSNYIKNKCQETIDYPFHAINTVALGGKIYNIIGNEIHVLSHSNFERYPIYTLDYKPSQFSYFQKTKSKWWAFGQNSFYHYDKSKRKYYRINKNPVEVNSLFPIDKSKALLISQNFSIHELFDSKSNSLKKIEVSKYISIPDLDKLKSISFQQGAYGCFHGERNILKYTYNSGDVSLSEYNGPKEKGINKSKLKKHQLINSSSVKDLIELLKATNEYQSTESFSSTAKDSLLLTSHLKEINGHKDIKLKFINLMLKSKIEQHYQSPQFSSSTNWEEKFIELEFEDETIIKILSSNTSENNLDLSWIIDINGLKYKITNIALWRHFNKGINPIDYHEKEKKLILDLFNNFVEKENTNHNK